MHRNNVVLQVRGFSTVCNSSTNTRVLLYASCNRGRKEMFYLTTHSTHFIYGYMASNIWLRTILIVRKETRCRHIGYSFRLTARVLLYTPSHRQDCTYHGLCYTSRGALAGTRNSSNGPPHEGSIRRLMHHERTLLPQSYISLFRATERIAHTTSFVTPVVRLLAIYVDRNKQCKNKTNPAI